MRIWTPNSRQAQLPAKSLCKHVSRVTTHVVGRPLSHPPIEPDADPSRRAWLAPTNCNHGTGCPECESRRNCGIHWQFLLKNIGTQVFLQCRTCFYVWSVCTAEPDRPAPAAVGGTRRGDAGAGPKRDVTGDAAAARSGGSDDGEWDDAVIAKVWLGDCARDVVTSRGGDLIYVMTADSVEAINSFHHIVASIPIGPEPKHMMMSSDGSRIYVTGYDGSLSIIDPIEMTAKTFGVQRSSAAAVSPDGE